MPQYVEVIPRILFKSRKPAPFRVLVISNCQAEFLAPFFELALADCSCDYLVCYQLSTEEEHNALDQYLEEAKNNYQLIVSLPLGANWRSIGHEALTARFGRERLFLIPNIYLDALFPDQTGLGDLGTRTMSPMGGPHSKIALGGWLAGLSLAEILQLFTPENAEKLGYLDGLEASEQELRRREANCDTDFTAQLIRVARTSFALYTVNHPTPNLIAHFVNYVANQLRARGQARLSGVPMNAMLASTSLLSSGVWPIYPELKALVSDHYPVSTTFILPQGAHSEAISREVFVERSIATYERLGREVIAPLRQAVDCLALIERVVSPAPSEFVA